MNLATMFAAVVIQAPLASPLPTPAPPPQDVMSQRVVLDRTGIPQLTEEQRRVFVCARRAPTGSRLARSWCQRRAQAEARAQMARESHEAQVLGSGWMDPNVGGGPK